MPRHWADRAIMFAVIALVAWGIIGLPLFYSFFPRTADYPAQQPAAHTANDQTNAGEPWLTKDAAGYFTFWLVVIGAFQAALFLWQLRLIRESLDDAKIAAVAAKESADAAKVQSEVSRATLTTMQDTAERQLRAYIVATIQAENH